MVSAYVLITAASGKVEDIVRASASIPEIKKIDAVTGPFDVISFVEAADFEAIGKIVVERIQLIDGVVRTLTCLVAKL